MKIKHGILFRKKSGKVKIFSMRECLGFRILAFPGHTFHLLNLSWPSSLSTCWRMIGIQIVDTCYCLLLIVLSFSLLYQIISQVYHNSLKLSKVSVQELICINVQNYSSTEDLPIKLFIIDFHTPMKLVIHSISDTCQQHNQ